MSCAAPLLMPPDGRLHDLCCVGTALVDHLSYAEHARVDELGLRAGAMTLVADDHAAKIRAGLRLDRAISGGTVANTAAGVAALGGRPVFVGAVADDDLGARYAVDLQQNGVRPALEMPPSASRGATGSCYVIVTPDAERTMATSLGVSGHLTASFVAASGLVEHSQIVYFDGYLLDFPDAEAIVAAIIEGAHRAGTRIAFGLADPYAVDRHRARMLELVGEVDLLFANEEEALALSGGASFAEAVEFLGHPGRTSVVTRGATGAVLLGAAGEVVVEAHAVEEVQDVTGAGDLFAAGVLFAALRGDDAARAGRLGALLAAEAIGHLGARPESDLHRLAIEAGLH